MALLADQAPMSLATDVTAADSAEIRDLMARYVRGVDRADVQLTRSCYHPDGVENHGPFQGYRR